MSSDDFKPEAFVGFPKQPYVMFGSFRTPGVAFVRDLTLPREWDEAKPHGYSGAALRYTGQALSTWKVIVQLWLPQHFIEWNLFAAGALAPPMPGAPVGPGCFGIQHPLLNGPPHNILDAVVLDCSEPVQSDTGLWTYTISMKEFKKPLFAAARPIAAIPAIDDPRPTAQDAAEVKMELLSAQAKKLGG